MSDSPEHPIVRRGAVAGMICGAMLFYNQYRALDLPPGGATFLGLLVGGIAGLALGKFVENRDGSVSSFFEVIGGICGLVISLAIMGKVPDAHWLAIVIVSWLGTGVGAAIGRKLWHVLVIVSALLIVFGPTVMNRALLH